MSEKSQTVFNSYLDWAKEGRSNILWYGLGFIIANIVFYAGQILISVPLYQIVGGLDQFPAGHLLLTLAPFVLAFIGIPLVVKIIHNRPTWSVALPRWFWGWRLLSIGFVLKFVAVLTVLIFFAITSPEMVTYQGFNLQTYLPLVLAGFVAIFFQAAAEEFFFRGYLIQLFRRFFSSPIIFLSISAAMFAVRHIGNIASFGTGTLAALPYFLDALMYGWVAYMTKSLWMPIGLHWGNNFYAVAVAGLEGDVLSGTTPLIFKSLSLNQLIIVDFIQITAIVLVVYWLTKRKPLGLSKEIAMNGQT